MLISAPSFLLVKQARKFREICFVFGPCYRRGFTLTLRQIDFEPLLIGVEVVQRLPRVVLLPGDVLDHVPHMRCVAEGMAGITACRHLRILIASHAIKGRFNRPDRVDLILKGLFPRHAQVRNTACRFIRTLLEGLENGVRIAHR